MIYSDDLETDMMSIEDWDCVEDEAMEEMMRLHSSCPEDDMDD